MDDRKIDLWNNFCTNNGISETAVPLFECDGAHVSVFPYGKDHRRLLRRSDQMDSLVIREVEKVTSDFEQNGNDYEGLIYMMLWKENDRVLPLYIGKAEKYGKGEKNLSENIRDIHSNKGKFSRWGYGYAYHIGDLSAVVCTGHRPGMARRKYKKWARALFKSFPSERPELRRPTFFWIKAWRKGNVGPWEEFGLTSLTFLEYLLIGLASCLFPRILLNEEGVNRG
jgi:hypothetical protein